ncbi:MAG: carbon-nitrogen hydrolase family protein [Planctomycetota bacterium]|jgi:predicted amidohydrolase
MKISILQPPYPAAASVAESEKCMAWMKEQLDRIEQGSADLIMLPEYANAPGIEDKEILRQVASGAGREFAGHIAASAERLNCSVAVGLTVEEGGRWFNRAALFDSAGKEAFHYDKIHLTSSETDSLGLTAGSKVEVYEYRGLRISFAICFDFYFAEYFSALAAEKPDLILCPSYQRSESAERICILSQVRALDTGAYLCISHQKQLRSKRS